MLQRVVVEQDFPVAVAALGVGQGAAHQQLDVIIAERGQAEDPAAGEQRPDQAEERVLRRCADQNDRVVFHMGQQRVLLGLVPAVDLVDKEDGALVVHAQPLFGLVDDLAQILDAGSDGVERGEVPLGGIGDHVRQGGLAHARRPPEDDRGQVVSFDGPPQQPPAPDDILLPDEFFQRARPHPCGQGRIASGALLACVVKQIDHALHPRQPPHRTGV